MTLELIHAELVRIREALEARPFAAGAPTARSGALQINTDEIPLPSEVIANAGAVTIHFGKNTGKPLSELSDRSLAWYATEQPPRLDSSGKPYPPRQVEITLRNAARTLFHQKRGTLAGAAVQPPMSIPADSEVTTVMNVGDESIPF